MKTLITALFILSASVGFAQKSKREKADSIAQYKADSTANSVKITFSAYEKFHAEENAEFEKEITRFRADYQKFLRDVINVSTVDKARVSLHPDSTRVINDGILFKLKPLKKQADGRLNPERKP